MDCSGVPPQNLFDRTIVDVSTLSVELTYPNASLAVRPAPDRWNTENESRISSCRQRTEGSEFYPLGHLRDHHGSHLAMDNVLRNDRLREYDPVNGQPVVTELYTPGHFPPKK